MYTPAKSMEDLVAHTEYGALMAKIAQLVTEVSGLSPRLFDNARTFSSFAYGELGNPEKFGDYAGAGLINLSPQKNYVGLYIWTGGAGAGIVEKYAGHLAKSHYGKGCFKIRSEKFFEETREVTVAIIKEALAGLE